MGGPQSLEEAETWGLYFKGGDEAPLGAVNLAILEVKTHTFEKLEERSAQSRVWRNVKINSDVR